MDERTCGSRGRSFSGWEVESRVGFLLNLQQLILAFLFLVFFNLQSISSQFEPAVHVRLPVTLVCQHVPTGEGVLINNQSSKIFAITIKNICNHHQKYLHWFVSMFQLGKEYQSIHN